MLLTYFIFWKSLSDLDTWLKSYFPRYEFLLELTCFCCFQVLATTAFAALAIYLKVNTFKIKYSAKLPGSVLSAADPSLERASVLSLFLRYKGTGIEDLNCLPLFWALYHTLVLLFSSISFLTQMCPWFSVCFSFSAGLLLLGNRESILVSRRGEGLWLWDEGVLCEHCWLKPSLFFLPCRCVLHFSYLSLGEWP